MQGNRFSFRWPRNIPRLFLGFVLVATGTGKLLDIPGFILVLDSCHLLPHPANVVVGMSLPFIELGTGIGLLTAIRLVQWAWLAVGLHVLMTALVMATLLRDIDVPNCGCFGVFFARPLTGQTLVEDLVMLGISTLVLLQARSRYAGHTLRSPTYR